MEEEAEQKKITSYNNDSDDSDDDDDTSHENGESAQMDTVIELSGRELTTVGDIFIPKHAKHFSEVVELNLE